MEIVNIALLRHPTNWLTVWLMVAIVAIGLHLVLTYQTSTSVPTQSAA